MATTAKKSGRKPTAAKKAGKPIVEEPSYLCPYCNTMKKRSEYYVSTDPLVKTGVTSMCKECAKKIAKNISKKEICIISGMALGIDTFAHTEAIKQNGNTIAVLGGGFDYIYPEENIELLILREEKME